MIKTILLVALAMLAFAANSLLCDMTDYCRVIWLNDYSTTIFEEQSAIVPIGVGCVNEKFELDLSGNYLWLTGGRVHTLLLLFRFSEPVKLKVKL